MTFRFGVVYVRTHIHVTTSEKESVTYVSICKLADLSSCATLPKKIWSLVVNKLFGLQVIHIRPILFEMCMMEKKKERKEGRKEEEEKEEEDKNKREISTFNYLHCDKD